MSDQPAPDYTGERIKHLEMIQGVVNRMAGNCAATKRYCIIAVAAGFAIHRTIGNSQTILAIIVMAVVFWLLDSRYLQQENWFRDVYDAVRREPDGQRPDFRLTPDVAIRKANRIYGYIVNWSTAGLYFPLVVMLILYWWTQIPSVDTVTQ